ncbi:MAG: DNA-binding response regulator [Acidobacteria bacterium]|nr:MAG: DNA-binding response regulator [Acidobacteriota bacterium]
MALGARILVVEDDASLRAGLERALTGAGYGVETAIRGADALRVIRERPPDLVVLDLMLPGHDGMFVLERARREGYTGPVIILSARSSLEDKLRGLELGADDYVTKPFDLEELLARIAVRLRRSQGETVHRFGRIQVDLDLRRVLRDGEPVHLTPKEFDLLTFLIRHPDVAHSRRRILDEVWGEDYEGTRRTVDNFIRSLRTKLEDDPENPRHLVTVWARGYAFRPGA